MKYFSSLLSRLKREAVRKRFTAAVLEFPFLRLPVARQAISIGLIALLLSVGTGKYAVSGHGDEPGADDEHAPTASTAVSSIGSIAVETVKSANLAGLATGEISYAGELLSSSNRSAYPQRSGPISEWLVKVGDPVKKGQPIAKLAPPPVTVEQVAVLAAQLQAVERARVFASASENIAKANQERFDRMRSTVEQSKLAATNAAKLDLQKTSVQASGLSVQTDASKVVRENSVASAEASVKAAEGELEAARKLADIRDVSIRSSSRRMLEIIAPKVFLGKNLPSSEQAIVGSRLSTAIGVLQEQSRSGFIDAYQKLAQSLESPDHLPTEIISLFVQATNTLLANSVTNSEFSDAQMQDLREKFGAEEQTFQDASKEFREAHALVSLKEADLLKAQAEVAKVGAEGSKDIAERETLSALNDLNIKASQAQLDKVLQDIELEYQKQRNEIDLKQGDVERDVEVAKAEARAAQTGYQSILSGVAGAAIVSPISGTISSISLLAGQNASPEQAVAIVTGDASKGSTFVRFSVPGDLLPPAVADTVTVERQDYPYDRIIATVTGVGQSLGGDKSLTVEAELVQDVPWPIGTTLRVRPTSGESNLTVPSSAIRLDAEAKPRVWIVLKGKTIADQSIEPGRSVGDRIEILSGLQAGDVIVTNGQLKLKEGQALDSGTGTPSPTPET